MYFKYVFQIHVFEYCTALLVLPLNKYAYNKVRPSQFMSLVGDGQHIFKSNFENMK